MSVHCLPGSSSRPPDAGAAAAVFGLSVDDEFCAGPGGLGSIGDEVVEPFRGAAVGLQRRRRARNPERDGRGHGVRHHDWPVTHEGADSGRDGLGRRITVSVVGTTPGPPAWPREGFVAVVSAESQEGAYLDLRLVERLPERSVLRAVGQQRWLPGEPVREALADLLALTSDEIDQHAVKQALELTDYAIATGTGVAVVPPSANR